MNSTTRPLISVVIPCFNGETFLADSIDSVLNQTYPNIELIVVDDGSTDNSSVIMNQYTDKIITITQANAGLPSARNSGIKIAKGEFIAFLDADDYWDKDFILEMHTAIQHSNAGIAYCGWQNIGLTGARGNPFIPPDYEIDPEKIPKLIENARWPVHAALVRMNVCNKINGFNPLLKSCEDFAFWIRTATTNKIVLVPKVLAYYRHHGEQMTSNRLRITTYRLRVQQEFINEFPDIADNLGHKKIQQLIFGNLLQKGYEAYWQRDLDTARFAFRTVFKSKHFKLNDLKYLLPSYLPKWLHKSIIGLANNAEKGDQ